MKSKLIGLSYITAAIILFILASCTGGNESIIGKPGFTDYLSSIIMGLGVTGVLVGVFVGWKDTPKFSSVKSKQLIIWSGIGLLFGIFTYYFS